MCGQFVLVALEDDTTSYAANTPTRPASEQTSEIIFSEMKTSYQFLWYYA